MQRHCMHKKITIGSRGSKLALLYAQKAKETIIQNAGLSEEDIVIKSITTKGDQVEDVRLSEFLVELAVFTFCHVWGHAQWPKVINF